MSKNLSAFVALAALPIVATQAAADDCVVRVTTWGGNYHKSYKVAAPDFEKKYKCRIRWVVGSTASFMVKARQRQVDVVTNNLANSIAGEKEKLWLKLDPSKIPNWKHLYGNAKYSPYTVFVNVGDYAMVYNSKRIKTKPDSWNALWDPKYKNRVATYYFESPGVLGLTIQQAQKRGGGMSNIKPGLERMAQLSKSGNLIGMLAVESQLVSLFQLEEAWIGMLATGRIKDLWDKGADFVKIVRPKEGTFPLITTANVVKTTRNPEMAMKFVNFMLGKKAQETFATRNLYAPTVKNAEIPDDFKYKDLLVRGKAFERLFVPDLVKLNEVKAKWREQFNRMSK